MNEIIKENKEKIIIIAGCFLLSFLLLMITSKSSFLYPMNDWGDANAFFTMGKGLFNGKVIFQELFEQKGPLLYLIYGIGYLISNQSFLGIFILEVISSTIFSYYIYKIITLYLNKSYSYIILPIFLMIIYSIPAFSCGGSCEEFCLPFLSFTIYNLLVFSKEKTISYKKTYLVGFIAGLIFLTKYLMLGVSFAFAFYLFVAFLKKKDIKKAFLNSIIFLLGMVTPLIPWLIYFGINNAIYDFFNSYIFINASYGVTEVSIFQRLFNCILFFARNLAGSGIHIFVIFCGIVFFIFNKKKVSINEKLALLSMIFFSVLFTYISGTYLFYYVFPITIFILFTFIGVFLLIKKEIKINKYIYLIYIILIVVSSYFLTPNAYLMKVDKKDMPQYQFAEIINSKKDATILNYGALDMGFYTVTGIVPNTKYFEKLNFVYEKYPDNVDSLNEYIKEKQVDFVIYISSPVIKYPFSEYLDINYEIVAEYTNPTKNDQHNYYLYQLK